MKKLINFEEKLVKKIEKYCFKTDTTFTSFTREAVEEKANKLNI